MEKCSCDELLNESITMTLTSKPQRLKSCPNCSTAAGHHVFYLEDTFGKRDMGDGRILVQSWCPECRVHRTVTQSAVYKCA